ncbi:Eco57I restriction-modification methylase domain-containing protein [Lactococcus raffinolactis]|uniref:Eco57I restriction-modification methylase domain-containing protein n=1 Tax=Pseudolactococcus raffinolactis TaxID=1366 RepID=UPI0015595555|nr:Eco57I restriction-modification methylase domain-containing protein [Lactococcus raffinolactis]
MNKTLIKTTRTLTPQIYAWWTTDIPKYKNWLKIGYTTRTTEERISEQASQMIIDKKVLWHYDARFMNGSGYFDDHDLHDYLTRIKKIPREAGSEWFDYTPDMKRSEQDFQDFVFQKFEQTDELSHQDYTLRKEQISAVNQTLAYFQNHQNSEFLWNAKPRFGKTLTTYDLARKLDADNVLVVTNRPAIANSWFDDFEKFIAWQTDFYFVSESETLKDRATLKRKEFLNATLDNDNAKQISFVSLQDLKGSQYFGGGYDKLKWVRDINWDLLVIDEAHEGVDTFKTDSAFNRLNRKWTLHLSGTPFKALASDKFTQEQVYTWSYEDEQSAKQEWKQTGEDSNPYEKLPTLNLFTYQLSQMMVDKVNQGAKVDEEEIPYFFDLNEFFSTNDSGKLTYEADVSKFLDCLTKNEKYPFSTPELRDELKHTFWLLNRVASAKALAKLLKEHEVFSEYEVIIAAGDGNAEAEDISKNEASLERVKKAIEENDKTITLSVGQLTTGITIPEWTAVMMLTNIKSPSLYMQAAFRAQNAYEFEEDGELKRKENAYIFDFAPERTLILFDEFANNLKTSTSSGGGTSEEREQNITTLLNFLPVIGEDSEGKMIELDAGKVLSIPHQLKATEVVRHGFMSNFLFANISGIFQAPKIVLDTLNQLQTAKEERATNKKVELPRELVVDETGNVQVSDELVINKTEAIFTPEKKIQVAQVIRENVAKVAEPSNTKATEKFVKEISKTVASQATPELSQLKTQFENVRQSDVKKIQTQIEQKIQKEVKTVVLDFDKKQVEIKQEYERKAEEAPTATAKAEILAAQKVELDGIFANYQTAIQEVVVTQVAEAQQEAIKEQAVRQDERKKKVVEDDVRDHLRGFSRTIPSFLMAYGDRNLTLANFDDYTPDEVFEEVTGITEEQFRFLRDGGDFVNESGETCHFDGQLFDETVFNQSIQEFLNKKEQLADYFDESHTEDIFDYIPAQKTNQIFTPKRTVSMMVDLLEKENPEIFKNKNLKFIDLYAKSGLYLTELVKRLNVGLKAEIPDETERIRHILEHQIYAVAPSEIIYSIAKAYVYGTDKAVKFDSNLKQYDLVPSAQAGTVKEDLVKIYGDENLKFDVVIGNPPYQESGEARDEPIYHLFMSEAYKVADKVCLITPARFLFNAGQTPKSWNEQMLNDAHLRVEYFTQKSSKVFPNTNIKGGVAITYRDLNKDFGAIEVFTHFEELNSLVRKVTEKDFLPFSDLVYAQGIYRFSNKFFSNFPEADEMQGKGTKNKIVSKSFSNMDFAFFDEKQNEQDIKLLGLIGGKRKFRWIAKQYLATPGNFEKYKVFVPEANGSGAIGEVLSTPLIGEPLIGEPLIGHTDTFLSIGSFKTEFEARALLNYVKTKFARAMLGILKITQHNSRATWAKVPLQDFTPNSDIDWTKSISEIDQQLYAKYGLSQDEIDFIEERVKVMV